MASAIKQQVKALPAFTFDIARHAYVNANGSPLTQAELRAYVNVAVKSAKAEARAIAEAFVEHQNSAELITSLKELIRNENLAMIMIANGGREQMTQSLYGRAGNVIKDQYGYADRLGRLIDNGDLTNFGEGFLNRVESYGNSGLFTFEGFYRDGMIDAGMTMAANELGGSAQSCDECQSLSDASPMSVDDMVPIGDRTCSVGCNCSVTYLTADEAANWSGE